MKIQFNIHYASIYGQNICIIPTDPKTAKPDTSAPLWMNYISDGKWELVINVDKKPKIFTYQYALYEGEQFKFQEWGPPRLIELEKFNNQLLILQDFWRNPPGGEKVLHSAAFQKVLMKNDHQVAASVSKNKNKLQFQILAPRINIHFQLCILGDCEQLGNWNTTKPFLLGKTKGSSLWTGSLNLKDAPQNIQYKYAIFNTLEKKVVTIEDGKDRLLKLTGSDKKSVSVIHTDESFRYPLGNWKGAGVSVPVFSLRTKKGFGIGEFTDLKQLIDWAKNVGLKMIQILPVNETIATHNWQDSYPYKSISVIALHPIYMNLDKMGKLSDDSLSNKFKEQQKKLNEKESIDYPEVLRLKSSYFKYLFDQEKETFFDSKSYISFFKTNRSWLVAYAAFAYLRDKMKSPDFKTWGRYSAYDPAMIEDLCHPENDAWEDIAIHYFIQFHLDKQLFEVTKYARKHGIVLKGDIPIGISPDSVEAWTEPALFNLGTQTGAPPDDFAIKGQNWGFPTYNWKNMSLDNYKWWKFRLHKMSRYFDAYRIDHILGFFRIWEIPSHAVEGVLGYFNPNLPLKTEEIERFGVHFNYDRMVRPYIRKHVIEKLFGELSEFVIDHYLNKDLKGNYELKPAFNTQKKVNDHFLAGIRENELPPNDIRLRQGLFDLIANVIFLKAGQNNWHPRVNMHETTSFSDLDAHTRDQLNNIYNRFYYRRHNHFWYEKAMEKLPVIIQASEMLVCGEDLGMVPDCVKPVMDQLNILSLEIQRMPKDPKVRFANPSSAPYLSVCTTSTHDMSTIRGWWEEDRERTQVFYNQELGFSGQAPYFAEPWVCESIINQHLFSPAMWITIPIQDLIAIDGILRWEKTQEEQINEPSNVQHKWKFRMKQKLEDLQKEKSFNDRIRSLIDKSGRSSDY